MLERLAFVMLAVEDVDRAAAFYRDVLGIPVSGRFGEFAFFDTGEARLALTSELRGRDGAAQGHECVFGVASVTQAYAALKDSVEFLNEPRAVNEQAWAVNFRDPDGHLLSLYGPR
jgi:catechol 2,3-dioxygenase-like lactoylglutathione lyase family enzyme